MPGTNKSILHRVDAEVLSRIGLRTIRLWASVLLVTASLQPGVKPCRKGQESPPDFTQPYLLLETFKGSTLESELNEAAAAGYCVQAFWYAGQGTVRQHGLLRRMAGASDRVEYRILEPWDAPALEKQLKEAAADGFRLLPRSLTVSTTETQNGRGRIRLLMEKVPDSTNSPASYEYFVGVAVAEYESPGDTMQKGPLAREMQRAVTEGYTLVGMLPRSNLVRRGILKKRVLQVEHILIGEKTAQPSVAKPMQTTTASQSDRYRLIAGPPSASLQAELHEAAAAGFRLVITPPTASAEMVFIFERVEGSADVAEYLVVGGAHTSLLEYQVNRAAAGSFRIYSPFVFTLRPLEWMLGMIEHVQPDFAALMEKAPGSHNRYEYALFENIDKQEFAATTVAGWAPVGVSHDSGDIMLLEKVSSAPVETSPAAIDTSMPVSSGDRLELATARVSTLRKELNEAAAQGYRLMRPAFVPGGLTVTVEKVAAPPGLYEYRVLSDRKDSKLQAMLNEAAAEGFRVVPATTKRIAGMWGMDTVVFMEKSLDGTPTNFSYRVLGATRMSTFQKELEQAKQEGGRLVGIVGSADTDHVAVLEIAAQK